MAGSDVKLEVDLAGLLKQHAGKEKKVMKAIGRSLRKSATFGKTLLRKTVASAAGIPQKAIKKRVSAKAFVKDFVVVVWLGMNPVPAHLVGKPRQLKKGVRVGRKHLFEGAFKAKIFDSEDRVWRRKFRGPGSSKRGRGDGRFPVELMTVPLDDVGAASMQKIQRQVQLRFKRIVEQEINYEINVKGSK